MTEQSDKPRRKAAGLAAENRGSQSGPDRSDMAMGCWMENGLQPGRHVLVDCGPWSEPTTKERFTRLRERVALRNFERVGNDRLVVRLPPKVAPAVLVDMPEIQAGANGYCWCTHGFV